MESDSERRMDDLALEASDPDDYPSDEQEEVAVGRCFDGLVESVVETESDSDIVADVRRYEKSPKTQKELRKKRKFLLPKWQVSMRNRDLNFTPLKVTIDSGAAHTVAGIHHFPLKLDSSNIVSSELSAVRLSSKKEISIVGKTIIDLRLSCDSTKPILL